MDNCVSIRMKVIFGNLKQVISTLLKDLGLKGIVRETDDDGLIRKFNLETV